MQWKATNKRYLNDLSAVLKRDLDRPICIFEDALGFL